jgi:hypothetical protein
MFQFGIVYIFFACLIACELSRHIDNKVFDAVKARFWTVL